MNDTKALEIINKIFKNVFEKENNYKLDEILEKFAFDIKLPKQVIDSTTNEITWADSINSGKFITLNNMEKQDQSTGWMLEKREINNLEELIEIWNKINLTTTERVYDSINVSKSDTIYRCENVYRSTDCSDSKNCSNCYNVICSNKISNSLFIQDSYDLYECIFCCHIANKRFCIANMQFEEEEYYEIKKAIISWIFNS